MDDVDWSFFLCRVPSHGGIRGNEGADALAAAVQAMVPSVFIDRLVKVHRIIADRTLRHHPHDDVARGCPLAPV